jgi:hypothetical protein
MKWLLLKDLQILRRSPLQSMLLVAWPVLIAVLVGFAISRAGQAADRLPQRGPERCAGQRRHGRAAENRSRGGSANGSNA